MSDPAPADAPRQPATEHKWRDRIFGSRFLLVSIGLHLLFGCIAVYVVVQTYQANRKLTFKAGPPSPNPSSRSLEHKVQMQKKQSTMSAPAVTRKITTTGVAKVVLPDMPAMPKLAAPPVKMAGAGGIDVSFNPGGASSSSSGGAGGAAVPFFGFNPAKGGGSLIGTFYDLKQLKNQSGPSKLDEGKGYPDELSKFVNSGWNTTNLERFFAAPNKLGQTQFYIPKMNAAQGPGAFGLSVQPKMWVIHYKGTVTPTDTGTFRFVGMGDDVLVVRFNGRVVLDCGSTNPSNHGPQKFYVSEGLQVDPKKEGMGWYKGLGVGDPVQVTAGETYPMEVLLGEWSGIDFKAWLLIEKEGEKYEKDKNGNPILPIFKLQPSADPARSSEAPVYAKGGPAWKAEKPADTGAAKK